MSVQVPRRGSSLPKAAVERAASLGAGACAAYATRVAREQSASNHDAGRHRESGGPCAAGAGPPDRRNAGLRWVRGGPADALSRRTQFRLLSQKSECGVTIIQSRHRSTKGGPYGARSERLRRPDHNDRGDGVDRTARPQDNRPAVGGMGRNGRAGGWALLVRLDMRAAGRWERRKLPRGDGWFGLALFPPSPAWWRLSAPDHAMYSFDGDARRRSNMARSGSTSRRRLSCQYPLANPYRSASCVI